MPHIVPKPPAEAGQVHQPVALRIQAGQLAGTAGGADGRGAEVIYEQNTVICEAVNDRCPHRGVSVTTEVAAGVMGRDLENIQPVVFVNVGSLALRL